MAPVVALPLFFQDHLQDEDLIRFGKGVNPTLLPFYPLQVIVFFKPCAVYRFLIRIYGSRRTRRGETASQY